MLQVAVHSENELTGGMVETSCKCGGLAKVAAQLHNEYAAVDRGNLFEQLIGAISGAVVNEHHFKAV